jgi:hypothetical protein
MKLKTKVMIAAAIAVAIYLSPAVILAVAYLLK